MSWQDWTALAVILAATLLCVAMMRFPMPEQSTADRLANIERKVDILASGQLDRIEAKLDLLIERAVNPAALADLQQKLKESSEPLAAAVAANQP